MQPSPPPLAKVLLLTRLSDLGRSVCPFKVLIDSVILEFLRIFQSQILIKLSVLAALAKRLLLILIKGTTSP